MAWPGRGVRTTLAAAVSAALLAAGCTRPAAPTAEPAEAPKAAPAAPAPAAAPLPAGATPTAATVTGGALRATGPVAVVNGTEIPAERFNAEFDKLAGAGTRIASDRVKYLVRLVLTRLIDQTLREQAIAENNIALSEAEMDEAWREFAVRFADERGEIDQRRLEAELARSRTTVDAMKAQIREQRLARKLVERLGKVDVAETEIRAFYDNNPSAWMEPESRDVRPIIVQVSADADPDKVAKAEAKAKEARELLAKGGDFETLAKQYGGAVPAPIHIVRSAVPTDLEKAAFALKVGEISQPIRTKWGFYVLRLIEKNDKRARPFAEVREEIRKTLAMRHGQLEERRILAELRAKAQIVEKPPAF